jgi:hypothetical protein
MKCRTAIQSLFLYFNLSCRPNIHPALWASSVPDSFCIRSRRSETHSKDTMFYLSARRDSFKCAPPNLKSWIRPCYVQRCYVYTISKVCDLFWFNLFSHLVERKGRIPCVTDNIVSPCMSCSSSICKRIKFMYNLCG